MKFNKKGARALGMSIASPEALITLIIGVVILTAIANALLPTFVTSLYGFINGANITAAQKTTLKDITAGLMNVVYIIAVVVIVVGLLYAFWKGKTEGRHR